ncbi:TerD family protein [Peterkaempfera sp. SMS 1(5)a]|uniref:TerD family protein n=1 Tax=Peterkaempfera podocarpi TaxID=3232308 RepID=UPI0036709B98
MTAELVRGQNHTLPHTRMEIQISAGGPLAAALLLADGGGRVLTPDRVVHHGALGLPGVPAPGRPASGHRLPLDLAALPSGVERVYLALVLPPGAGAFGSVAAPHTAVLAPDGTSIATFTLNGLTVETAVVALELYLRAGAWKLRAVGQGYADGVRALLHDHGVPDASVLATAIWAPAGGPAAAAAPAARGLTASAAAPTPSAAAPTASTPAASGLTTAAPVTPGAAPSAARPAPVGPPAPVAGDAPGRTLDERLYNQVWGIFEDAARSTSAYRSAVEFADSRQEAELEALLADPAARFGPAAEAARSEIRTRRDDLERRAREVLERDGGQLLAEALVVEEAMPAPMARWESAAWADWRPAPEAPHAVRLGELHLPEHPQLRIPMLQRLPLARGLWVDSGLSPDYGPVGAEEGPAARDALRAAASTVAFAVAVRLLACHRPGALRLHAVDGGGSSGTALAAFARAGLLAGPPAVGRASVTALLESLVERVDLMQMALRGGAADALPPRLDPADRLLLVQDFPYGFDDRALGLLRCLAEDGPAVGVHLLLVADREDAREHGRMLDTFWRLLTRLAPVPQAYLADPWVEHLWTYMPPVPEPGSTVLVDLLRRLG